MQLFDAHCHLQDEKLAGDLARVMERAAAAGVAGAMCCGSAEGDWPTTLAVAEKYPHVQISLGLHPWYVGERQPGWLDRLRTLLAAHPRAGVGEIGLDHALENADPAVQEQVFLDQFALSIELRRPASLHCRRAFGRLLELLPRFPHHPVGFVVHSFSGAAELVAPLVKFGAYFSFSGSLTRSGNRRGYAALRTIPAERLLLETDSPDLMPVIAGRVPEGPNEPANLIHVLRAAVALRSVTEAELASQIWANTQRLFDK
ncbi:MAG: TatD family hydrolase [Kiritimatiellaeota bacterium]|nr:TatD family hydrolase [Kiritimatiellota bacterium]